MKQGNGEKADVLDPEWVELMLVARDMGLSIEEIQRFLTETVTK